jgi:hypothetical protein
MVVGADHGAVRSLRSADLRFLLPHHLSSATVLACPQRPQEDFTLRDIAAGLAAAGIVDTEPARRRTPAVGSHAVVASAGDAKRALELPAGSHLLLGRVPTDLLHRSGRTGLRLLVQGDLTRPAVIVPLRRNSVRYHLDRRHLGRSRVLAARSRVVSHLAELPVLDRWLPDGRVVTLVTDGPPPVPPPELIRAVRALGVVDHCDWVLVLGHGDDLQRAVFHLLEGGRPRWVLKFSRVAGHQVSFARDEIGLGLIRDVGGDLAARAPSHLGRIEVSGLAASVETAAPGAALTRLLGGHPMALIDRIAAWVVALGVRTATPPPGAEAERRRLVEDVLPAWRGQPGTAGLVEGLPSVPGVLQHNDLGSWNIVTDGRQFTVVDWESARAVGLPLWDLCYLLADVLPRLEGPADADTLVRRTLRLFAGGSPYSERLFGWVREAAGSLQIPDDAVGALASLCWMSHAMSSKIRAEALAGAAAAPSGHLARLAGPWLAHPDLGPSWKAWSA